MLGFQFCATIFVVVRFAATTPPKQLCAGLLLHELVPVSTGYGKVYAVGHGPLPVHARALLLH